MRFSHWIGNGHDTTEIMRRGVRAEQTGWDGLWLADHFMPFAGDLDQTFHEVWALLGALAHATERVRLGPMVVGNTYRNPAILMKQAVTTDHLADGRVVLGIGAGWQENEHLAYGIEYGTFTDRFEKLEESLQILRGLRSEERFSLDGAHYQMTDAPLSPKPVGDLPILVGGGGEKKTLRMVAQYAEEWNVWATPEIMAQKIPVLDAHCERLGRDPSEIVRTAVALLFLCESTEQSAALRDKGIARPALIGTPAEVAEQLHAFADLGVDEVIIPDFNLGDGPACDELLDRFLSEAAVDVR